MTVDDVCRAIRAKRYSFATEDGLQTGIALALAGAGIHFTREAVLSKADRIDFLLDGGIGIEVKVDGSLSALTRQLARYAERPEIERLVVVSTRLRLSALPATIGGKPITSVVLPVAFA